MAPLTDPRADWGARFLRLILWLYPRSYRERYGDEILSCFRRDQEVSGKSIRFWSGLIADHLIAVAHVRSRRCSEATGVLMRTLGDDLLLGCRALARSPAFTAFAALTVALGVGATTAAFSVLDRVALQPLPYPGASRFALLGVATQSNPESAAPLDYEMLLALRRSPGPVEEIVGTARDYVILGGVGEDERIFAQEVTEGFFPFFGARPAIGRLFVDADHDVGAVPVAVISHRFWTARFGRASEAIGSTIRLDSVPHVLVGVLSEDFVPPEAILRFGGQDVWTPLKLAAGNQNPNGIHAVARLRPPATFNELAAHATPIIAGSGRASGKPSVAAVRDLRDVTIGGIGATLARGTAAVALLLVIACVNLASLLLTRASERARDLSLRSALGAARARIVRQLVSESVVIGLAGGALGGGLAFVAVELFRRFAPEGLPRLAEVTLDIRAAVFSLGVAFLSALVFGLVPALHAARQIRPGHAPGMRATMGRAESGLRSALILFETAVAVLLVVCSGLLTRDLVRMSREDPGYRAEGLIAASVHLDILGKYGLLNMDVRQHVWLDLLARAHALPHVQAATLTSKLPTTAMQVWTKVEPEGYGDTVSVSTVHVDSSYFAMLGMRLVEGRWLVPQESQGHVTMVNEAFVREFWPSAESAIGKTIVAERPLAATFRVVGVTKDARLRPGVGPAPEMYVSGQLNTAARMELLVRSESDLAEVVTDIRDLIREFDPALLVDLEIRPVDALARAALVRPRFYTLFFSGLALLALFLAALGVYGTTAFVTRARTQEMGIRLVLGASRRHVIWQGASRTMGAIAAGVAFGVCVAAVGSQALDRFLVTVPPHDAFTYCAMGLLVLAAGGVAAVVPAARAGRADPAQTLRESR